LYRFWPVSARSAGVIMQASTTPVACQLAHHLSATCLRSNALFGCFGFFNNANSTKKFGVKRKLFSNNKK